MNEIVNRPSGALASLQNLKAGLQTVASSIVTTAGDPFLRLLKDGDWVYGQENIEVEKGSYWAVNTFALRHGWVSWTDNPGNQKNEIVGEVMVPMTQPLPPQNSLPDTGWPWTQQLEIQLKCTTGEDTGQQVRFKTTSVGGMNAMSKLIDEIMKQLDRDPDRPIPVIELQTDSYPHKKWGKTYIPIFDIVKWVSPDVSGEFEAGEPAEDKQQAKTEAKPAAEPERTRTRRSAASGDTAKPAEDKPAAAEERPLTEREKLLAKLAELDADDAQAEPRQDAGQSEAPAGDAPRRRRRA